LLFHALPSACWSARHIGRNIARAAASEVPFRLHAAHRQNGLSEPLRFLKLPVSCDSFGGSSQKQAPHRLCRPREFSLWLPPPGWSPRLWRNRLSRLLTCSGSRLRGQSGRAHGSDGAQRGHRRWAPRTTHIANALESQRRRRLRSGPGGSYDSGGRVSRRRCSWPTLRPMKALIRSDCRNECVTA
jgi:hypothetical protein